jgi:hypothetical protein
MSDIGLILNGLLGALLVCALLLGWRLERRLKALRLSHQSFARSVEDLDRAAARAEQGLADLRAATDEAAETLAGRIDRAKSLSIKLEKLTDAAAGAEARLASAPRLSGLREDRVRLSGLRSQEAEEPSARPAARASSASSLPPSAAERLLAERRSLRERIETRGDLILEDEVEQAPPPRRLTDIGRSDRLRPQSPTGPAPVRSKARVDDELFERPLMRRTASGGAR